MPNINRDSPKLSTIAPAVGMLLVFSFSSQVCNCYGQVESRIPTISTNLPADSGDPAALRGTDSKEVQNLLELVRNGRDGTGAPLALDDYCERAFAVNSTRQARYLIYEAFMATHTPTLIEKPDLIELLKGANQSVESLRYVASVTLRTWNGDGEPDETFTRNEFVSSRGRLLLATTIMKPGKSNVPVRTHAWSYDGSVIRTYIVDDSAKEARKTHGSIAPPDSTSSFFIPDHHVMYQSMLADTFSSSSVVSHAHDARQLLAKDGNIVFAYEPEPPENHMLLFGEPQMRVWCDLEKNFTITRLEMHAPATNGKGFTPSMHRSLSEHEEVAPGVWLPRKTREVSYGTGDHEGEIATERIVVYDEIGVNELYEDAIFSDIIPLGTPVSDGVRHLVYVSGDNSIEDALRRSVGQTGNAFMRTVLLVFNGILLALVVAWLVNRRSKPAA